MQVQGFGSNKEAVRKSIAFLAVPKNSKFALKALYKTTDEIWRTVGDRSTDISFYTKRGILAEGSLFNNKDVMVRFS